MRTLPVPPGIFRQTRRHAHRAFSTSSIVKDAPQTPGLPPARLRALVSLYHVSSNFITPATLSSRIDAAFASNASYALGTTYSSYPELKVQLEAKRSQNKFGPPPKPTFMGIALDTLEGTTWSDHHRGRQKEVDAALWGTEWDGKPSVETVLETKSIDEQFGWAAEAPSSKSR